MNPDAKKMQFSTSPLTSSQCSNSTQSLDVIENMVLKENIHQVHTFDTECQK